MLDDSSWIGADFYAGIRAEFTGIEAEAPIVPGADGAGVFHEAGCEASAGVRAIVVHDEGAALVEKGREWMSF